MTSLRFSGFENTHQLETLRERLTSIASLFPRWLDTLYIIYGGDEEETVLSVSSQPEYRQATLNVYPEYFTQPFVDYRETLIHEAAHIRSGERDRVIERMVATIRQQNDLLADEYAEAYRVANEAYTEDWAVTLEAMFCLLTAR